jgi:hypothetical protein
MAKRRESTQPFLDHETLTQAQQARFLGSKPERTKNLGHDSTVDRLTQSPVGYPRDYENGPAARVINETRSVGVYGRFKDPKSGISSADNLSRWSGLAHSNSYDGKDPKGRGEGSDEHLASTKNWPGFEYGSESGLGRIEKTHSRK